MKSTLKTLLIAIAALAAMQCMAYDIVVDDFAYKVNNDEKSVTLTDFLGNPDTLKCFVIPDYIVYDDDVYPVTSSMVKFNYNDVDLNEIYFGRNLIDVLDGSLNEIVSVKKIKWNAVSCDCYPIITMPMRNHGSDNLKFYDNETHGFAGLYTADVDSIIIGCEVKSLPSEPLLYHAKISSFHIPASLIQLIHGSGLLISCLELNEITVDENNPVYDSRENCNGVIRTADNALLLACPSTKIPSTVTTITSVAFFANKTIKEFTLPSSINKIDSYAFRVCHELEKLTVNVANPNEIELGYQVFGSENDGVPVKTCVLRVPKGSASLYKNADQWKNFKHIEEMEEELPTNGDVDANGIVDVEDVNAAINIILKLKTVADYPGNGDMNGDGVIDVEDVNAIINIILKAN